MTRQKNDTQDGNESQVTFKAMLREQLQHAVRTALVSVLEAEVDASLGQCAMSTASSGAMIATGIIAEA
jgi:hypothetical protein